MEFSSLFLIFKSNNVLLLSIEKYTQYILMSPGNPDLILLILVFVGLQAWWIIPIIKRNNKLNNRGRELREEIKQLEKIYKK